MNLKKCEQETIINFNNDESKLSFYTCNKHYFEKLRKLSVENPLECKIERETDYSIEVIMPKNWFRFPKAKRILSEVEKEKRRENMNKVLKALLNT